MTELLNEMESALTDLLRTGLRSASSGVPECFRRLSADCEATGLHTGASLLGDLAIRLEARTHAIQKEDPDLAAVICRTVRYIELCRERLTEQAIRDRWQQGGSL